MTTVDTSSPLDPVSPTLEPLFRLVIRTADAVSVGETPAGSHTVAAVSGGLLTGPGIDAVVRPLGTESRLVRADGSSTYAIDLVAATEDGDDVMRLTLRGFLFGTADVIGALDRGDEVDSATYYFRGTLDVSTASRALGYLNRALVVTSGARHGSDTVFDAYLAT
ncbi:DUF3237 family protein [Rhodococcoides corynebacterioides]|uniref:DUF3237 family protein n=1 Tax=Rhodococcoides corynebacterioides TaxID=53972 RepID=A0ABS7P1I2_9NOCA|nr:DUF3237 family protein [Rhodococcus corynebacterioides]MBY6366265.1 DUF3237 family protein [Rhodococcus corynebacterioides]MBY6406824.1 DUF3237 family protein [Rhodococcus corynebacterioides]